ncbi:coniferyl-alcohol dehydrogenase [Acidisoma cladoniae]|jgi:NAD(P)-dependent dehydrogenase (short-subunit alcohol dehydrogenase family)|uniref:coniferyl-alcohol dehydrogenase n=1 Tax=Acidisoma cladoniae TaxID=3040935 RepID=UPI0025518C8E|nr:coniferyl-alcohol dehydrogenase [Acidisoma sp. PAMC 29798]
MTVVVTGVASGIGAGVARLLRDRGMVVIGVDRREPATGTCDHFVSCDLGHAAPVRELVANLPAGIRGLCNIAGLPPTAAPADVLKVNAIGLRTLTLGLIPKLADGGSIVNLASFAGHAWRDNVELINEFHGVDFDEAESFCQRHAVVTPHSYFFSKQYIIAWTLLNRWTWRSRGIRMNCVSPGPVETPILQDFVATLGDRVEQDMAVMDRSAQVADLAPIIAFLLEGGSSWLRGTNIEADGGLASHYAVQPSGLREL